MDGFDTMTMSNMAYLANPMALPNGADPLMQMPPFDHVDHSSNFDADTFAGSDDIAFGQAPLHPHHHGGALKRFPSQYDETFSDALSAYDQPTHLDQNGPDNPEIDGNNKLLSFSPPTSNYALLDFAYQRTSMSVTAQLHGMFFLAESPWTTSGDASAPPTELTCYRRNLFQITGEVTMPRSLRYIMTEQGDQIPIVAQELAISATESVEGNSVKIISVPWKTPAANAPMPEDKTEKEPSPIALDMMNGQDLDSQLVNFPIAWKRLQFRIATANNGRRKELQQHFVVKLTVMATLATGNKVPMCEVQSGAIIVRGRSPRNFQSRKDFPISGGSSARKHAPAHPSRTSTGESVPQQHNSHANNHAHTTDRPTSAKVPDAPHMTFAYDPNDIVMPPEFWDWKMPTGQAGAMTALPQEPAYSIPAGGSGQYAQSSPDLARTPLGHMQQQSNRQPPSIPINLSLTDEEPKKSASPSSNSTGVKKAPRLSGSASRPSFSLNVISSPDESADLLYEYFPLGLDDWMPPVDAVYRPHVVHHTNLPQDPKAMAVKNKSKRYFSQDEP